MQNFYTTASAGKDIADLKPLLEMLDAVLIDVRFQPAPAASLKWSRSYLRLLLKNKYRHIPQLGNRTVDGSRVSIHHLELGIRILIGLGVNAVLMCDCADSAVCHRLILTRELRRKNFPAAELESWKIPELPHPA